MHKIALSTCSDPVRAASHSATLHNTLHCLVMTCIIICYVCIGTVWGDVRLHGKCSYITGNYSSHTCEAFNLGNNLAHLFINFIVSGHKHVLDIWTLVYHLADGHWDMTKLMDTIAILDTLARTYYYENSK